MRRLARPLGLAAALAGLLGAVMAFSAALAPGDHRFDLVHESQPRSYLVHVPPQARFGRPLPVVINFHGGGGAAEQHKTYTGMDRKADAEGFIAVYPNGSGRREERFLTWNAGHCCGYAQAQGVDDVGFVAALLDDLARRTSVDGKRVYATGLSNGAMMAYQVADRLPERIAAVAPVAGTGASSGAANGRPVPILHIHSVDDGLAHYSGGLGTFNRETAARIVHPPVESTVASWAMRNGCASRPRQDAPILGRGEDTGHTATRIAYGDCREGAVVVLFKLTGPGHVWPGGQRDRLRRMLGTQTAVIDANTEMWRFFSRHSLP